MIVIVVEFLLVVGVVIVAAVVAAAGALSAALAADGIRLFDSSSVVRGTRWFLRHGSFHYLYFIKYRETVFHLVFVQGRERRKRASTKIALYLSGPLCEFGGQG